MLSQALICNGRGINPLMLTRETGHSDRMTFSLEKPTEKDFYLWEASIETISSAGLQLLYWLGALLLCNDMSYRWSCGTILSELYQQQQDKIEEIHDIFCKSDETQMTWYTQTYQWMWSSYGLPPIGKFVSVDIVYKLTVKCLSEVEKAPQSSSATDFWDVLHSYEN